MSGLEVTEAEENYMRSFIRDVIEKFGPRMPCSSAEIKAAEYIKAEMEKYCDDVHVVYLFGFRNKVYARYFINICHFKYCFIDNRLA
ncbi:MAG: hypothetical protein ACTSRA_11975 [Promethearchaeota archaeon]